MARFIPVDGQLSDKEENLIDLFKLILGGRRQYRTLADGRLMANRMDSLQVNQTASDIARELITGAAILYTANELGPPTMSGGGNAD